MQLKIMTDYAMRIVLYMASKGELVTSQELSDELNVPKSIVFKICKTLNNNDILNVTTGAQGGFTLKKSPENISVHDIISLFEASIKINRCLEDDNYCNCKSVVTCKLHKLYYEIQKEAEDRIKATTIKELI